MVCEMAQGKTEDKYPKMVRPQAAGIQGLEAPAKKARATSGTAAKVKCANKTKKYKKPQRDFKTPAVPGYAFEKGEKYDVYDSHKSLRGVEYAGHEVIGHLVLYCFMQGEHPYKFSEPALRMYGKAAESETGIEVMHGAPPSTCDADKPDSAGGTA